MHIKQDIFGVWITKIAFPKTHENHASSVNNKSINIKLTNIIFNNLIIYVGKKVLHYNEQCGYTVNIKRVLHYSYLYQIIKLSFTHPLFIYKPLKCNVNELPKESDTNNIMNPSLYKWVENFEIRTFKELDTKK